MQWWIINIRFPRLSPLDPVRLKVENKYLKDLVVSQLDLIQQQVADILHLIKSIFFQKKIIKSRLNVKILRILSVCLFAFLISLQV